MIIKLERQVKLVMMKDFCFITHDPETGSILFGAIKVPENEIEDFLEGLRQASEILVKENSK